MHHLLFMISSEGRDQGGFFSRVEKEVNLIYKSLYSNKYNLKMEDIRVQDAYYKEDAFSWKQP